MMKTHILTLLFTLAGLVGMAQTNQPLPSGAIPFGATTYLSPLDSTIWLYKERDGTAIKVANWVDVDSLFKLGYTKVQVDSAITAQIGGINFPVTSVNSMTGDVTLAPTDLGLGNVDNTSDADKPVSNATQSALDGKENAFSKGSLVAGTGVTLDGTLSNRLVGLGNVTINASNPLTASNGLQIISGVISPQYGTLAGTVAQGNDARINNGQTAFNWGDYRQFGLGTSPNNISNIGDYDNTSRNTSFVRSNSAVNTPFGVSGTGIHVKFSENRGGQLWIPAATTSSHLQYRFTYSDNSWTDVRTVWDDANFTPPTSFTRTEPGLVPNPGGSGSTRFLREDGSWVVPSGGGGGGTATDLSIANRNANTLQIGSSTGTNATIPSATTSLSGLMTASDKSTLNSAITIETDPTVPAHVKSISSGNISNWNTSYNWGDFRDFGLGVETPSNISQVSAWDNVEHVSFIRASSAGNSPFPQAGVAINIPHSSGGARFQLFAGVSQDGLYFRRRSAAGSWAGIRELWHDGNFTPSDYLQTSNFTWSNLSGKPSTFTPSAHSHNASDINSGTLAAARIPTLSISKISGLQSALDAKATSGTGSTQVRNNSQLDARYLQSVSGGSGISVSGGNTVAVDGTVVRTSGNQTVGGTKTFSSPVVVANATNSNHAVTLGQVNSLVPESPDWTQYGTEFVIQERPVIYPSGYFPVGSLSSLGVPYWANVLANSFVNEGDMVEVDGIIEITTDGSAGTNSAQIILLGSTFTLRSGDPNIYDVNIRFRYNGGTSVSYVIKVSSLLGANTSPYLDIFRGNTSMSLSNNILISARVNTATIGNRSVNVHEVRVTKYSAKFNN